MLLGSRCGSLPNNYRSSHFSSPFKAGYSPLKPQMATTVLSASEAEEQMCEDLTSFGFLNVHSPAYLLYVKEPTLNHSFMKTASSWRN
jgi:hypothetical protein